MVKSEKINLYLLSIVGIVAVVGIVILLLQSSQQSVWTDGDIAGQATSATCTDTDGGFVYTAQGTATGSWYKSGTTSSWTDSCKNSNSVYEYYCRSDGTVYKTTQYCATKVGAGSVCSNGACTEADADGDGVADTDDVCDGEDDTIDIDEDSIPDCIDDDIEEYCMLELDGNSLILNEDSVEYTYADGYGGVYVSVRDIKKVDVEDIDKVCDVNLNSEKMVWMVEGEEVTLTQDEHDHTIQLISVSDDYKTCSFIIDGESLSLDVGSASELSYTDLDPYGKFVIIPDAKSANIEEGYQDICLVGIGSEARALMTEGESVTFSLADGDHTVEIVSVYTSD